MGEMQEEERCRRSGAAVRMQLAAGSLSRVGRAARRALRTVATVVLLRAPLLASKALMGDSMLGLGSMVKDEEVTVVGIVVDIVACRRMAIGLVPGSVEGMVSTKVVAMAGTMAGIMVELEIGRASCRERVYVLV